MQHQELRTALMTALAPRLGEVGYRLNKSQAEFTKKTASGWAKFQLIFLERSNGWEINPGMLLRKEVVEAIYHRVSSFDPAFHKTTPTIGITVEDVINDGQQHRFQLTTEADIALCLQGILTMWPQVVEPFFRHYDRLEHIEAVVNDEKWKRTDTSPLSGPIYKGHLGIILAKLVNSPRYDHLVALYRAYYEWLANGYYLPEYEAVVRTLREAIPQQ